MWIFTKEAFLSVVSYDPKHDTAKDSPFRHLTDRAGTHLLVRARVSEDLNFVATYDPASEVSEMEAADYRFRCVMLKTAFQQYMVDAVEDITYDSHFKEVVRANASHPEARYSFMMSIWSAGMALQRKFSSKSNWDTSSDDLGYTSGSLDYNQGFISPYGSDAKRNRKSLAPGKKKHTSSNIPAGTGITTYDVTKALQDPATTLADLQSKRGRMTSQAQYILDKVITDKNHLPLTEDEAKVLQDHAFNDYTSTRKR
jgi:hypothetical protein